MKKAYIYNDNERNTLYFGIASVYGEFVLTTEGDPTCLNELEDANNESCDALISSIQEIITDPSTPWEPCDEGDEAYVSEWLSIWGIA